MDGVFSISTFTEPRFRKWSDVHPKTGTIIGLVHHGANVGVFAIFDYGPEYDVDRWDRELKVYLPTDTDFKGWGGKWWPLSSICSSFPDSEIARHFSGIQNHPDNYLWIYPNLEPYVTEDWYKELLDATPDLKLEGGTQCI